MPEIIKIQPDESCDRIASQALPGIPEEHFRGKSILVKPNWVNRLPPSTGATVDPLLVRELVAGIYRLGAERVAVGEASLTDTEQAFNALKVRRILTGTEVIDFSREKDWINIPVRHSNLKNLRIPAAIRDFDTIVSVAKLKTHCQTRVSFTVKNLFGLLSRASRQAAHKVNLDAAIAGIYFYLKERMNIAGILDGIPAMEGKGGPLCGKPVALDLIIAGGDALEVDLAGCLAIGCPSQTVGHLSEIGNSFPQSLSSFRIDGYSGAYPIRRFTLPPLGGWRGPLNLSPVFKVLFKKKPVWEFPDRCTLCADCLNICPAGSIAVLDKKIVLDAGKCVECLCCTEACSHGAMGYTVRLDRLHGMLRKTLKTINEIRAE